MESRFAHLYKRDSSASMIRLKMSRRRSESRKENREKMQNQRRHLDQLPEMDMSMDTSCLTVTQSNPPPGNASGGVNVAVEERKRMLARYKENKLLQKEKEKREKEKKGVFKVGLYKAQPLGFLPVNSSVPKKAKVPQPNPSTRVTRSMMQSKTVVERQAVPKKDVMSNTRAPAKSLPKVPATTKGRAATVDVPMRAPNTRSAAKVKPSEISTLVTDSKAPKTRSGLKNPAAPSSGNVKYVQRGSKPRSEDKPVDKSDAAFVSDAGVEKEEPTASFAPQDFEFQPPTGLKPFEPVPLSPGSASCFHSSTIFQAAKDPTIPSQIIPSASTSQSPCPPVAVSASVSSSSPEQISHQPSTSATPPPPLVPLEPQHEVAYFRNVMASETERLTGLSQLWEERFDDFSIPEDTRDQMRTVVGQARLLMKERFGQFSGLVDDCDLGRGEKITTCTDLQGFWEMVYFQVEDVNKKFNALQESEARGWKEEARPVVRRKVIKKPPGVGVNSSGAGGSASTAAKSRLAAVKAAMRAKQAEQQAEASTCSQDASCSVPPCPTQTVVFNGGFFKVESPIKPLGPVRRSSRISGVSKFQTPGKPRRSNSVAPASPNCVLEVDPLNDNPDVSVVSTPQRPAELPAQSPKPLQISPARKQTSDSSPATETCSSSQACLHLNLHSTLPNQPLINGDAERTVESHDGQPKLPVPLSEDIPNVPMRLEETSVYDESPAVSVSVPASSEAVDLDANVSASPSLMSMPSTPSKDLALPSSPSTAAGILSESSSAFTETTGAQDPEEETNMDFERYLQPTVRVSMSPEQSCAEERFSLGMMDAEMESPRSHTPDAGTPTELPRMPFTPWTDQMSDHLLMFTPEQKDRVRQSVCERDLMSFTPPAKKNPFCS